MMKVYIVIGSDPYTEDQDDILAVYAEQSLAEQHRGLERLMHRYMSVDVVEMMISEQLFDPKGRYSKLPACQTGINVDRCPTAGLRGSECIGCAHNPDDEY